MQEKNKMMFDSISCLHALEHFGLGRYGDMIDPQGYEKGLFNISSYLTLGGKFSLQSRLELKELSSMQIMSLTHKR